jgi:hypothetical protein
LLAPPIFNKRTAEALSRHSHSRIPDSFLDRFELSVAIERLERFEPTVVGRKRLQIGNLKPFRR